MRFLDANLLDFQLPLLVSQIKPQLDAARGAALDEEQAVSAAYVALCVERLLEVTMNDAIGSLTEANGPVDLDAMWLGDVGDQEFVVALFRGAYPAQGASGRSPPDVAVGIQVVRQLFAAQTALPPRLAAQVAEVSSRVRDGHRPRVCFYWCSEAPPPRLPAAHILDSELGRWPISFAHIDHDRLIRRRLPSDPICDCIGSA